MVGFIKGIFSGKKKDEDEVVQLPKAKPEVRGKAAKESLAYFLETDDAQSLGNAEYMRAVRSIRRTFPKTLSQPEEQEFIQEVSALKQAIRTKGAAAIEAVIEANSQSSAPKADPSVDRRRSDSSMDMFRNMARDINKK